MQMDKGHAKEDKVLVSTDSFKKDVKPPAMRLRFVRIVLKYRRQSATMSLLPNSIRKLRKSALPR